MRYAHFAKIRKKCGKAKYAASHIRVFLTSLNVARVKAYLRARFHLDPSNRTPTTRAAASTRVLE